jgi:hypothetical protein
MKIKLISLSLFAFGLSSVQGQTTISTTGGNATGSGGSAS